MCFTLLFTLITWIKKDKNDTVQFSKCHSLNCEQERIVEKPTIVQKNNSQKNATQCSNQKKSKNLIPELIYEDKNIKIILSDFTTKLKPDRYGNSIICKEIIEQINSANNTIDIAIYGYDSVPVIEKALINAKNRGVKIRLLYDINSKGENIYKNTLYFANLIGDSKCDIAPNIVKYPAKYTNSLMHDKFYIFDSKILITGSANASHTDMSGFNSNSIIVIKSDEIARIYEKEFNQMYESKFHHLKEIIPNKNNIIVDDSLLSTYFSPKDDATHNAIIPLIDNAKSYIYIPTFLITDNDITNALINAKKRNVDIKIIIDAVNAKSKASKHQILRDNNILVKTENYAGKLHSKTIIIDDIYLIIGSMNFSKSGNYKNDENLLILKNSNTAIFYRNFFEYLWEKIPNYWLHNDVAAESIYSIGSCSDGIDNDYDGKIDSEDEGCKEKIKQLLR